MDDLRLLSPNCVMSRWLGLLIILAGLDFTGCADSNVTEARDLASLTPSYVTMAESLTSLIANELGVLSGPPTPGAMIGLPCARHYCRDLRTGNVSIQKQVLGCTTPYGKLDGSSYLSIENVPGLRGCTTSRGPATFESWPPASGEARLAIGQSNLQTESVPEIPGVALDRYENSGEMIRHWGAATLRFNGTPYLRLDFDHWAYSIRKGDGAILSHFHARTEQSITLTMEQFWDSSPRIYNGSFILRDQKAEFDSRIVLSNLIYKKQLCCHPLSGKMTLTPEIDSGTSTFIINFDGAVCGQAEFIDALGRMRIIQLPECAS